MNKSFFFFFYELVNPVQKHSELFRKMNRMNSYFYFFFQAWKYTFIELAKKIINLAYVFHRRKKDLHEWTRESKNKSLYERIL